MKFFVNFLSAFRICASFVIVPTLMLGWYWTSLLLFVLGSASDWFDGYLARKYNVCTKLGGVMDHIGDKLLVVNTLIMLSMILSMILSIYPIFIFGKIWYVPIWMIVIPIILMIARELYISGLREFLGTQKIEMPVPKARFSMGKIKTTVQMITITAFLLWMSLNTVVFKSSSSTLLFITNRLVLVSVFGLWMSLLASVWSATQYTKTFIQKLKLIK